MKETAEPLAVDVTAVSRGLRFLWLEITGKCNLECGHCYAESGPSRSLYGAMSREDWLEVLREAAQLGCASCQFIGGEPTLHPDFRTFVTSARQLGMAVEVYTNATRLTADLVDFLAVHEVRIATSFYSECETVHDRVTGRGGSWTRTVGGIERVVAAGLPLRVGFIETAGNAGHYPAARRFLETLGVERIGFDYERHVGRASTTAHADPMDQLCGQCSNGRLCITADAKAYPCVFSRFVELGDPRVGLAGILASPPLTLFQTELDARFAAAGSGEDNGCGPEAKEKGGQLCSPRESRKGGQLCSPQEIDRGGQLCSPREIDKGGQLCSPQEIDRICSPHETCSPGK